MIAIGFDFDHTLGIDNKLERTVFLQLAEDLGRVKGVGYDEGHAAAAIDAALSAYRRGMGSIDELLAQTFETVVGPGEYADAIARFRAQCIARCADFVRALPGVEKTLAELALRGIPTAILTNGWTPLQERKAEAIGFVGPVLVSDAIGVRKPDQRAFTELCAALDAPAANVWYVGDDPAADVCGSLAAGLRGIWFDWEKRAYPADLPRPSAVINRMEELLALTERAKPMSMSKPRFVSEPLTPSRGTADTVAMARGEPGMPKAFVWRGKEYEVAAVRSSRKGMGEDRGDVYVRRHYYEIETKTGERMTIYFDRNPTSGGKRSQRWWLYTIEELT